MVIRAQHRYESLRQRRHERELDAMEVPARLRQNAHRLRTCGCCCLLALDLMDVFTAQSFQPAVSREVIRRAS
jgi:hypothetical protein